MLPANDNIDLHKLELAIWKMLRAGLSTQIICSTLRISESALQQARGHPAGRTAGNKAFDVSLF